MWGLAQLEPPLINVYFPGHGQVGVASLKERGLSIPTPRTILHPMTCSPKSDPCVKRVSTGPLAQEILDERTQTTQASWSRTDHRQAS